MYHVKLSQFEGPLDLLLHLINNAKIRIEDIFISEITEQYIRHMEEISELDMDRASEFLQMAATLLYIKSRTLLPRHEEPEDKDEGDPEQELIERLRQYKLYKEACEGLKGMEKDAEAIFYKLAEETIQFPQKVSFEGITLDALCKAYLQIINRMSQEEEVKEKPLHIVRENFSIKDKMYIILKEIRKHDKVSFFSLFKTAVSRLEAAVTFLALLELLHRNDITIKQQQNFEDIMIYSAKKVG